jgi:hypothetical protein
MGLKIIRKAGGRCLYLLQLTPTKISAKNTFYVPKVYVLIAARVFFNRKLLNIPTEIDLATWRESKENCILQ